MLHDGTLACLGKNEGVRKMVTAERKAVVGSPDLGSLTTYHIERAFLSVRQELKRFQRKGLGYSKDLETHKAAVALYFGIYNFVRVHSSLQTTPAVAPGVELERWSLERVVDMTRDYLRRKEDTKYEYSPNPCYRSNATCRPIDRDNDRGDIYIWYDIHPLDHGWRPTPE
jgi:IS1 transposase